MELLPAPTPAQGDVHKRVAHGADYETHVKKVGANTLCNDWAFQCCGLGTLQGISGEFFANTWQEKAKYLAALYIAHYIPGHVLFAVTNCEKGVAFQALCELGAQKIAEFPNLAHGPNHIHLYLVNVHDGVGRFFTKYGEPFAEQPDPMPPVPAPRKVTLNTYHDKFPIKVIKNVQSPQHQPAAVAAPVPVPRIQAEQW